MPALFARDLCGYRSTNGKPNTSDANDPLSIQLGLALFRNLQVEQGQAVIPDSGDALESAIAEHLRSLRPDLTVARSRPAASSRNTPTWTRSRPFAAPIPEHRPRWLGSPEQSRRSLTIVIVDDSCVRCPC